MATNTSVMERASARLQTAGRLLVTQREPETASYRALGFLTHYADEYAFAYLASAVSATWFRPLPGLSRIDRPYRAPSLFPLFAERVISAHRPDRQETMAALGLPQDAAPFEVLSRSGGRRVGDAIELVPVPEAGPDGAVSLVFLAHGIRYLSEEAQQRVGELRQGQRLQLLQEPTNAVNARALLVADGDQSPLGYVPDPLVEFVHEVKNDARHKVTVERANGAEVGYHFRLLVRIKGRIAPGTQPFSGREWSTIV